MKKVDLIITIIGFIGLVVLSLMAIIDPKATDILSGFIVQLMFASLFIGGYISYSRKKK